ncbi:ABC transporter ATP-binding protein [Enterococcus sp. LJL90]
MTSVLKIEKLSKTIARRKIIQQASFEVKAGQVVGLLGPNGAGKTTLIRLIVGLMEYQQGNITVAGLEMNRQYKEAIARVGAIVENPEFYNYLSGYDNLLQYLRMAKNPLTKSQLTALIRDVHLEKYILQKVKTYSLGMRQRLGIAQALLHQPDLLVLDEPMNGLDPKGLQEFRKMIAELKNRGISVLISSHQLSDIEQMADHLVVLQKGQVTHQLAMSELQFGEKRLIIDTDNNLKAAAVLQDFVCGEVLQENQQLLVQLKNSIPEEVAKILVQAGIGIKELRPQVTSLEATFLKWTAEGGL